MPYDLAAEPACVVQFSLDCDVVREELEAGSTGSRPVRHVREEASVGFEGWPRLTPAAPTKPAGVPAASSPV